MGGYAHSVSLTKTVCHDSQNPETSPEAPCTVVLSLGMVLSNTAALIKIFVRQIRPYVIVVVIVLVNVVIFVVIILVVIGQINPLSRVSR